MSGTILLTADDSSLQSIFGPPQWGIFNTEGTPVLVVESVADIEYARDYDLSDYPQEQGAFETYNKVQQPFAAKIGFLINQTRVEFLQSSEAAAASLALVVVVTPEISYPSANIIHLDYRRSSQSGVTMIRVNVWLREVRITAGTQLGSTAATTSNATPSNGASPTVGQPNSGAIAGNPPAPPTLTQSTNGASPTSTGQVAPQSPGATNPSTGTPNPTTLTAPGIDPEGPDSPIVVHTGP
jgi:hypothetical protein